MIRRKNNWILHLVLTACCLAAIFPIIWVLSTSFKPEPEVFSDRLAGAGGGGRDGRLTEATSSQKHRDKQNLLCGPFHVLNALNNRFFITRAE